MAFAAGKRHQVQGLNRTAVDGHAWLGNDSLHSSSGLPWGLSFRPQEADLAKPWLWFVYSPFIWVTIGPDSVAVGER